MYLNTSDMRIPLRPNAMVQTNTGKRFIIDKYLASGGFCLMYLAHQEGSGRYVALKELYPRQAEDALIQRMDDGRVLIWNPFSEIMGKDERLLREEFSQYFHREVRLTKKASAVYTPNGQLDRQNNLDVLQVEGPMTDSRGNLYLAIDTYQGESLRDFIERGFVKDADGTVLSNQFLAEIIHILSETSLRLSSLHEHARMYHLDLSPDNIYLAYAAGKTRRQPFIIDYGSAFDKNNPNEQVEHKYTYNPHSSPEIFALAEEPDPTGFYHADESSDTYSLASILFYAATGLVFTPEMRMFCAEWKEQIIKAYSSGISPSLAPESFASILIRFFEKGLASSQMKRFRSAKELLENLVLLETNYQKYGNLLPLVPKDELMSYLVLEKHPLYRYKSADGDIHVLCLGSGVFVKRMILSLISCGQIIGSQLHIHTVSNEPQEAFRKTLLETAPALTGLSNICGDNSVAYVTFHYERVEDVLDQKTCLEIVRTHKNAHYILISLGKNRLNAEAASLYAQQLSASGHEPDRKTIINYYSAEDAAKYSMLESLTAHLPGWLEIDAFEDDLASYTAVQHELGMRTIRLAHMYNKISNPRISLAETERDIAENEYNQKSSCASALHLKYKLAGIGIDPESGKENVIPKYIAALQGNRYGLLLQNEHNRWMMNLVSEGYRKPTLAELRRFGFEIVGDKFNDAWKSKDLKLHPCLVPCGEDGLKLSSSHWDMFDTEDKIAAAPFDELDKVSLLLHMLSGEKCRFYRSDIEQNFKRIRDRLDVAFSKCSERSDPAAEDAAMVYPTEQLKKKLENVQQSICNAAWSLQYSGDDGQLKDLQNCFDSVGINISGEINMLRNTLSVFKEYSETKDYKEPDVAIVKNLLWLLYATEDVSLIKLCGRTISGNVTVPLVMDPQSVVFYGSDYQSEWVSFLRDHGYCGQISFLASAERNVDSIAHNLQNLITRQSGKIVIDITEADEIAVVAAQRVCGVEENIGLIRTSADGEIENIHNFREAPLFTLNTQINADDIYKLHGAKHTAEHSFMDQLYEYVPELWEVYQEFKDDWVKITALFAHKRANSSELYVSGIAISPDEKWENWRTTVSKDHWNSLDLTTVFEKIQTKGIVRNFDVCELSPGRLKIEFQYPAYAANGYLATSLSNFFKHIVPRAFAPFHCEIWGDSSAGYTLNVKSGYIVNLKDNDLTFSDKRNQSGGRKERIAYKEIVPALERLEKIGIISDLNVFIQAEPYAKVNISFVYSSLAAKKCLQTAGNILELYIWYQAKKTRFFDSVQCNSSIIWKEGAEQEKQAGLENELDVILTKGLTSLIISAKTAKFNKEHLYEIIYLTDRFSFNNSKAVIVYSSAEAIEDGHKTTNLQPVKNRARAMGIYLIDLNELAESNCSLGEKLIRIATGEELP